MAKTAIVDASFLVALWCMKDQNHQWAVREARNTPPPWLTSESAFSEADHLLAPDGGPPLRTACRRGALRLTPIPVETFPRILDLMEKYSDLPMSVADASLVLLCEIFPDPILLTTDSDFRIYRRFGRRTIPLRMP